MLPSVVLAQQKEILEVDPIQVNCGNIIEGNFESNFEVHNYTLELNAGDQFQASVTPFGDRLRTATLLVGPTQLIVAISDTNGNFGDDGLYRRLEVEPTPTVNSGVLDARGKYQIEINNFSWNYGLRDSGGIGVYTLFIGCTLRDGTVINPGDAPSTTPPQNNSNNNTSSFSGTGFPGLAPVDFSNVAKVPVSVGVGAVTPNGGEILGFTLDASAGDTLALTFTRLSGNLNLGLVVLSADNRVVFQASLVTSSELTTKFTLPSTGQYTIGVFRIDLLPPTAPEATAFQVTATLTMTPP